MPNVGPEMPYFDILWLKFVNNIVMFEISLLGFTSMQNFVK